MTYINLGCGERIHPAWLNLDLAARGPNVVTCDLAKGIPCQSNSADAIYQAALFEHIRREDAGDFLREIYRVLKPGGIVRIGVPDLERICRLYLEKLEHALAGEKQAEKDYDWMMLEMLDQMVRERSGGQMLDYMRRQPLPNEQFLFDRIGHEGRTLVRQVRGELGATQKAGHSSFFGQLRAAAQKVRDRLAVFIAGRDAAHALRIGRFRLSGEVHHWMYDQFSLARELIAAGFDEPKMQPASKSAIPGWEHFHLDVQPDGTVNKPDLLFMEAIKPIQTAR